METPSVNANRIGVPQTKVAPSETSKNVQKDAFIASSLQNASCEKPSCCISSCFSAIGSCFSALFDWLKSLFCCGEKVEGTALEKAFNSARKAKEESEIQIHLHDLRKLIEDGADPKELNALEVILKGVDSQAWRAFVRFFVPRADLKPFTNGGMPFYELIERCVLKPSDKVVVSYFLGVAILVIQTANIPKMSLLYDGKALTKTVASFAEIDANGFWKAFYNFLKNDVKLKENELNRFFAFGLNE